MTYSLTSRRLDRLTPSERARLNLLTLKGRDGWYSAMRTEILWRKKALDKIQLYLIRDERGTIVAWSSVRPVKKEALVYTYVMQAHRRQKLGTRLINRAVAWCHKRGLKPRIINSSKNSAFFKALPHTFKVENAGY